MNRFNAYIRQYLQEAKFLSSDLPSNAFGIEKLVKQNPFFINFHFDGDQLVIDETRDLKKPYISSVNIKSELVFPKKDTKVALWVYGGTGRGTSDRVTKLFHIAGNKEDNSILPSLHQHLYVLAIERTQNFIREFQPDVLYKVGSKHPFNVEVAQNIGVPLLNAEKRINKSVAGDATVIPERTLIRDEVSQRGRACKQGWNVWKQMMTGEIPTLRLNDEEIKEFPKLHRGLTPDGTASYDCISRAVAKIVNVNPTNDPIITKHNLKYDPLTGTFVLPYMRAGKVKVFKTLPKQEAFKVAIVDDNHNEGATKEELDTTLK